MADDNIAVQLAALEEQIRQLTQRLERLEHGTSPSPVPIIPPQPFTTHVPAPTSPPPLPKVPINPKPISKPTPPHRNVEAAIGKNFASWIGAILLLLSVCFFLKYAWDHQWIHPTPMMRMLAGVLVGCVMAALGEWTLRRKMPALAGACYGAAIAIIMTSFMAGAVYFPLAERPISINNAFLAVAITALGGIAIALRSSNPTPAVIALIGAYLSPFILNTGSDQSLTFLLYITLVTAVGWALDFVRWRWAAVRFTACLGAWISYSAWQSDIGSHHQQLALTFACIFYGVFLIDFLLSAQQLFARAPEKISLPLHNILAVLSLFNTFFAFIACYQALNKQPLSAVGIAAIALALTQAISAFLLGQGPLKISNLVQSMALTTLAVPLLLDHFAITLAWAIMSASVCVLSRQLNMKWLYRWSISLWLLALAHLLWIDAYNENLWITWLKLGALPVSLGLLITFGLAVLAHFIANMQPPSVRSNKDDSLIGPILAAVGTLLFLCSKMIHPHPAEWTYSVLIWAALLLAVQPLVIFDYTWHILALLLVACIKWLINDSLIPLDEYWFSTAPPHIIPFLSHSAIAGILLLALLVCCTISFHRRSRSPVTVPAMSIWIGTLLFAFISIETCRCVDYFVGGADEVIKQVALSILWAAIGFTAVSVGFRRKITPLRYAALALLGITLMKILIIDMADVEAIWRILSFLAVGLLLLAVSYIYHKQFAQIATE